MNKIAQRHHIPLGRTADIFEGVDHRISEGTVISASEETTGAAEPIGNEPPSD